MRFLIPTLALAACTAGADTDRFREMLPDDRLEIDEAAFGTMARSLGAPSDYALLTRETTREVNTGVRDVLQLIDEITSYDASWTDGGSTALWGPWLDDGTYGQLWVTEEADGSWSWAIEIRPEESAADAWVPVVAGEVDTGGSARRNTGRFFLDFTAVDAQGAGDGETGQMACEYELRERGAVATVSFGEFSEDGSIPVDAGYHYEHTRGEGGLMDVAAEGDMDDPDGLLEVYIVRSRWDGTGAGRADAYVTGGTLGPLTFTETECWDAARATTFFENNHDLERGGDEASCVFAEPSFNE